MKKEKNIFFVESKTIKHENKRDYNKKIEEKRNELNLDLSLPKNLKEITKYFISLYKLNNDFFEFDGEINFITIEEIVK
jgi:hypothetical protein